MSSIRIGVPENDGLLTTDGELFHPDPKEKAEIRFKAVTAVEVLPGYRDASDGKKMIQIDHIVTDTQGRRFVFTAFLSLYFFWDQMFQETVYACSPERSEDNFLLEAYARQHERLIENLNFYDDGRRQRALVCYFPIVDDPKHSTMKIFHVFEKHLSADLTIISTEFFKGLGPDILVEFSNFPDLESTDGMEYGGNETDKLRYRFQNHKKMLWRQFEMPVVQKYGTSKTDTFDGVSFEYVSPLSPIRFRELK
jgi:hypothetical protein